MILAPTLLLNAGSGAAIARPTFSRDFAGEKTLNNGTGPAIAFTRASNATFFDANGTLQTATNDTPRFDHSSGNSLGLLIEEARTNLLTNSKTFSGFSGGGWTSVTDDHSVSPDGTTTASLFAWSTIADSYKLGSTTITSVAGATYTSTAFIKPVSGTGVMGVRVGRNDGSQYVESRLNLGTNANTSFTIGADVSGVSVSAQSVGNGWYRLSATGTFANSYANFGAQLVAVSGSGSFLVWGAQLEAGTFPTSYIPTTTAAATRAADSAVVTPISSFYNQSEGTLFAEYRTGAGTPVAGAMVIDDGTNDNRVALFLGASQIAIAATYTTVGGIAAVANTIFKSVLGYRANDHAASVNGAAVATNTAVGVPSGLTTLGIGAEAGGTYAQPCGHIRRIAYFPKRLSNTLLQSLTT